MKTDILIEPEVKGSEQLYKEIYIVIHTAYIVYYRGRNSLKKTLAHAAS